jgi:tetratricopeptide (TPR) repeat protein
MWWRLLLVLFLGASSCSVGQSAPAKDQDQLGPLTSQPLPRSQNDQRAPRGPGDSSSRDNKQPDEVAESPDDGVTEMHSWDPHKAQKSVEVGDYYFKQHNYGAALSRYCEALSYKPNDAVSNFRIAEALDKLGDLAEAQAYYQAYLKILPGGPLAGQCRKALDRIKARAEVPNKHLAEKQGCEAVGKAAKFRPEPLDPDRPVLTRDPTSQSSGKSQ